MNNRFVKNNVGLLTMTTVCSVVALVELIAVIVYSIQMYNNIKVVKDLSGEIRNITKQRPVPVRENEEPIKKDTEAYEKASRELQKEFGRPLEPAVKHFFDVLCVKKSAWLPEDIDIDSDEVVRKMIALSKQSNLTLVSNAEFDQALTQISAEELAKKIKALGAEDEILPKVKELVPDPEKLSEADLKNRIAADAALAGKLRELFPDAEPETLKKLRGISEHMTAEQFVAAYDKLMDGVDERNYATRRMNFQDFRRDKFENWKVAREAFINAAENRDAGEQKKAEPCIVEKLTDSNADEVLLAALGKERRFDGKAEQLQEMIKNITDQLKKEYNITLYARASGLGVVTTAETTGNESAQGGSDLNSINPDDYPAIANHLDIIGYMLYRVGSAGVDIWDVQIRLATSDSGDGNAGERRFGNSKFQRDGGFDVYHYTIEVSGTMAQIRAAVKRLDDCYAVRRVYLVKNISLYAESNIVDGVFEKPADNPFLNMAAPAARGGDDGGGANDDEARRKKALEDLEKYKARQARLDYDKRDGYGAPITAGGETERFRAVIDVEYVVKPR